MKAAFSVATLALLAQADDVLTRHDKRYPGYIRAADPRPEHVIEQLSAVDLPKNFSWDNVDGVNYLTNVKNQHIPQYCGSCWAQAATSAMSDRIKIMRKAAWPDINIAPQVLISCEMQDFGCSGGDSINGYKYIFENGITDETCSIYRAIGHTNGAKCSSMMKC